MLIRSSAPPAQAAPELRPLTERELRTIVRVVHEKSGIALHEGKRALVTARLQKRLKATGSASYGQYLRQLAEDESGEELVALLDAITTNHTGFFREPEHFTLLARVAGEWAARPRSRPFEVWCAACATGEEPYSIAMTLWDTMPEAERARARVLASDLSTKAITGARTGTFRIQRVEDLDGGVQRRHFERGHGLHAGAARVRGHVRRAVDFTKLNLIEVDDLGRRFPVIFCRNVMIYFDRPVQQRVVSMLEHHLDPGGYLFIAHAESLNGLRHGLEWVAPAVYRRSPS